MTKLKDTHTGDTLCDSGSQLSFGGIEWPQPDLSLAVTARTRADEDKIGSGLAKLHEEDPTFSSGYDPERGQTIIRGLGEIHLNISLEKMTRKYGVNVDTHQPNIAYRETITKTAEGQGRHKKQSGGRGQFGDCYIRLSPLPRGEGYKFVDSIKSGVIPTKFVPAVGKGIGEASGRGVLAGYPVVDFQAECYDGSHHSVDSSDIAFQIAGSIAFQKVARDANPVILEPIMEIEVETPEEYMGEVMGDLNPAAGPRARHGLEGAAADREGARPPGRTLQVLRRAALPDARKGDAHAQPGCVRAGSSACSGEGDRRVAARRRPVARLYTRKTSGR